jgi:hypothetical protein
MTIYYGILHPTKGLIGNSDHVPYPNEKKPEHVDISNTLLRNTREAAEREQEEYCPEGKVTTVTISF